MAVRAHAIFAPVERGHVGGDEFLVPTLQSALAHQRLNQSGDAESQRMNACQRLVHVGYYAAIGKQCVVEGSDLGRNLAAFQQCDPRFTRSCSGHHTAEINSRKCKPITIDSHVSFDRHTAPASSLCRTLVGLVFLRWGSEDGGARLLPCRGPVLKSLFQKDFTTFRPEGKVYERKVLTQSTLFYRVLALGKTLAADRRAGARVRRGGRE